MPAKDRARILYIPHGGGPLPLLSDEGHRDLVGFLRQASSSMPRPGAIIVVSAHWEASVPTVTAGSAPPLIYDYFGFPKEAYRLQYPAPGDPGLAAKMKAAFNQAGLTLALDTDRGFDHGLFVPLLLMYPEADIPCVQLSLVRGLDPALHLRMGQALAALRGEDLLILGSGFSFHNMQEFFRTPGYSDQEDPRNDAFQSWLVETCGEPELAPEERLERLATWSSVPHARYCHPREEHLLPLHVCVGAAAAGKASCKDLRVLGKRSLVAFWGEEN